MFYMPILTLPPNASGRYMAKKKVQPRSTCIFLGGYEHFFFKIYIIKKAKLVNFYLSILNFL